MKIVTAQQMRDIDRACDGIGLPTGQLMENAGQAFASETVRLLGGAPQQEIVILVGPGNNGGDGLVAARYFHQWGAGVTLFLLKRNLPDDPNLKLALDLNLECNVLAAEPDIEALKKALSVADIAVDAVLGTGSSRPLEGIVALAVAGVNQARQQRPGLAVFALDVPSGLNSDTGRAAPSCLRADYTVTLAFPKKGLFSPSAIDYTGRLSVVNIGIPAGLADGINLELTEPDWVGRRLPSRPAGANKGTFGKLLVVAGSAEYIGAASLACEAALRSGTGLVTLAAPASLVPAVAARLAESTYLPLPESSPGTVFAEAINIIRQKVSGYDALLIGCGLGQQTETAHLVTALLLEDNSPLPPLVVDADALNILAGVPEWWRRLPDNAILTPHPGEMGRLASASVEQVQSDRLAVASENAAEWHKTVVLKGAYTVTSAPDGRINVNPSANPALATAGTGDVLSGVVAGLVARGMPSFEAAVCGVFIHSLAGETLRERMGDTGIIASDLLRELPFEFGRIREMTARI